MINQNISVDFCVTLQTGRDSEATGRLKLDAKKEMRNRGCQNAAMESEMGEGCERGYEDQMCPLISFRNEMRAATCIVHPRGERGCDY